MLQEAEFTVLLKESPLVADVYGSIPFLSLSLSLVKALAVLLLPLGLILLGISRLKYWPRLAEIRITEFDGSLNLILERFPTHVTLEM